MDQAQRLREIVARVDAEHDPASGGLFARKRALLPRIITCAACEPQPEAGYLAASLAVGLAKYAPPLPVLDASGGNGLARVFGGAPEGSLMEIAERNADPVSLLREGPAGINLLRLDNSLLRRLERPAQAEVARMEFPLARLKQYFSALLLFTDVGVTMPSVNLLLASQEAVLFTSATEDSMKNCYMLVKLLARKNAACSVGLAADRVSSPEEGRKVTAHIAGAARKFLGLEVRQLGSLVSGLAPEAAAAATTLEVINEPRGMLGKCVDLVSAAIYTNTK